MSGGLGIWSALHEREISPAALLLLDEVVGKSRRRKGAARSLRQRSAVACSATGRRSATARRMRWPISEPTLDMERDLSRGKECSAPAVNRGSGGGGAPGALAGGQAVDLFGQPDMRGVGTA